MTTHNSSEAVTPEVTEATPRTDPLRRLYPHLPELPSVTISGTSQVRHALEHYLETTTDWENLSDEAETTDPFLWQSIQEAFTQARHAVYQQMDAYCAHMVARTLLADRKHRQEQRAKRGSHQDSDAFTRLLSNYAAAVQCFREAQAQGKAAENTTPEERRGHQGVKQAEEAIDAFLEAFYIEETGLKA